MSKLKSAIRYQKSVPIPMNNFSPYFPEHFFLNQDKKLPHILVKRGSKSYRVRINPILQKDYSPSMIKRNFLTPAVAQSAASHLVLARITEGGTLL